MNLYELETYLNQLLAVSQFKDYAPNGLQVEGRTEVKRIVTGVTACQALVDQAVELQADAIIVHHGYFWKNESPVIRGMKKRRLTALLTHEINLFSFHLPLDAHAVLGNNAQLANLLGIQVIGVMDEKALQGVGNIGFLDQPTALSTFGQRVTQVLGREAQLIAGGEHTIQRIAWCSGAAQQYIDKALELGADAYLSGEISEPTVHFARENGIHYIAAGHHASERYGVKALGEHLSKQFGLEHTFIDVNNPV